MLKYLRQEWWAYDLEWTPDPDAGRRLYEVAHDAKNLEVLQEMWKRGGATDDNPQPYLKTLLCRIVSVSVVIRKRHQGDYLELRSLPKLEGGLPVDSERDIIERFLRGLGKAQAQLIGYNSKSADIVILIQRAMAHGVSVPELFRGPSPDRNPEKPADYFNRYDDAHIDLMDLISMFRRPSPSLHELAVLSGIPGKMDCSGENVPQLWLDGKFDDIVCYNECDALTTYLVWIRFLHLLGRLNDETYRAEQQLVEQLLEREAPGKPHLAKYREEWLRLRAL